MSTSRQKILIQLRKYGVVPDATRNTQPIHQTIRGGYNKTLHYL